MKKVSVIHLVPINFKINGDIALKVNLIIEGVRPTVRPMLTNLIIDISENVLYNSSSKEKIGNVNDHKQEKFGAGG